MPWMASTSVQGCIYRVSSAGDREASRHNQIAIEIITSDRNNGWVSMTEFALILISTILVNNFVLVQFLGLCPFMGVSGKLETAIGMSAATTFVLTLAAILSYITFQYILVPLELEFLRTIAFILVIAVVVQFTEMVVHKTSPLLYRVLGIFLPLITSNCAIMGLALFLNLWGIDNLVEAVVLSFGAGIGFTLAICLMAGIRENLELADVPESLQGAPITLVTAGLMTLAFMGFSGMIR